MEAKDVIERLCQLQGEVYATLSGADAADCFCGESGFWGADGYDGTHEGGYRNDGKALEFIEAAVREKLNAEQGGQIKLYAWQPDGHGSLSFFVASSSLESAKQAVDKEITRLKNLPRSDRNSITDFEVEGFGTDYYQLTIVDPDSVICNDNE